MSRRFGDGGEAMGAAGSKIPENALPPPRSPLLLSIRQHLPLVALGVLLTFGSSFGQTFFVAMFNQPVQARLGLTEASIGLWYMVATLASAATLPLGGRLLDRLDLRLLLPLVFAGLALGCLLMASAASVPLLVGAYYLLRFSGQGMMGQMTSVTLARYIEQGRGLALGIAPLGVFAGQILLPSSAVLATAYFAGSFQAGWRGVWMASAAVVALALLPAALLCLRGHGRRHRAYLAQLRAAEAAGSGRGVEAGAGQQREAVAAGDASPARSRTRAEAVRDWRFWCLMFSASCTPFVATAMLFHQGWVVARMGLGMADWAAGVAVFSVVSALTAPTAGWLLDRVGARRCVPAPAALCAMSALALAHLPGLPGMYAALALLGVANAAAVVSFTPLWVELYGSRHLGAIKSLVSAFGVGATAAAPALLGGAIGLGASLWHFGQLCSLYALAALVLLPLGLGRPRPAPNL